MTSLREMKKAQTRQKISDVATVMFAERGFESVTIAEIAAAAGVSKVTVFNYYGRKEDILFDRVPEIRQLLTDALADHTKPPVEAVRTLMSDLAEQRHPFGGFEKRYVRFWHTITESPALRARTRELVDELTDHLATLIDARPRADDAPPARLTAALITAVVRHAFTDAAHRLVIGEVPDIVTGVYLGELERGFAHLTNGIR